MYIFISAPKTIPTYPNSYFLTIPPIKKERPTKKTNKVLQFFEHPAFLQIQFQIN